MGNSCLPKLLAWLEHDVAPHTAGVTCRKPARKVDIDALVAQEGVPLPAGVPPFLRITDGLQVGRLAILGCDDLHLVPIEGRQYWLIGVEDDAHFVMAPGASSVGCLPTHDARPRDMIEVGNSFPGWLRSRLAEM